MKTNIKSKKFYADGEKMQEGWGKYLRYIDELKDKKQNNSVMSIADFCWTLYGDGHCSQTWESFKKDCEKSKILRRSYSNWEIIFRNRKKS